MLLGNGLLPMFAVGGGMIWNGATWAIDGSGRAYNVPMLGAELMINPGFDSDTAWTKDTGWTIASGVATKTTGSASWIRQATATAGRYHRLIFDLTAISVGAMQASIGGFAIGPVRSSIGAGYIADDVAVSATYNGVYGNSSTAGSIDNVSLAAFSTSELIASVIGASSTQTAAARIHALTPGTQAGIVSLLDSATSPQNMLVARHNGERLVLEKFVAGFRTTLINVTGAVVSGAQIEIRRPSGNTFQLWYNGVQRGTDQTVDDASIVNNLLYGLFSTFSGNLFSEFTLGGAVIPFGF